MTALLAAWCLCGAAPAARAQDSHLLVVTGVSGDEAHAKQFHGWAVTLIDAATRKDGVAAGNIIYLGERTDVDPARIRARATRENVQKAVGDIAARARPGDAVLILLVGHGSFDGRQAAFNLPGPDLSAAEWAIELSKLAALQVAFVNTASSSGAFTAALAGPGRAIVTATRTGGERNETRFAEFFVEAFSDAAADADRNGHVSVLEAFDYAKNRVAKAYEQDGLLLTEHATLEDGAQGRLAATLFLAAHPADGGLQIDRTDPELSALAEQREAIQRQIDGLKLRKDAIEPARYDQDMERLLIELALKTRAIRERQAAVDGRKGGAE